MGPAKLYNVEVWQGKYIKHTLSLNAPYPIALIKRKELVAKGTPIHNVWIVPVKSNSANTKGK